MTYRHAQDLSGVFLWLVLPNLDFMLPPKGRSHPPNVPVLLQPCLPVSSLVLVLVGTEV